MSQYNRRPEKKIILCLSKTDFVSEFTAPNIVVLQLTCIQTNTSNQLNIKYLTANHIPYNIEVFQQNIKCLPPHHLAARQYIQGS